MKQIFLLISLVASAIGFAETKFVVSPYIIVGDNNQMSLNFQTDANTTLNIDVKVSGKNASLFDGKTLTVNANSSELQKVALGKFDCDKDLNYTIKSKEGSINLSSTFKSPSCDQNQSLYFGFMSDTQIKDDKGQKRADTISQTIAELKDIYPFTMIVNGGDVVQHGGREEDWLNYFNTAKPYLKNTYMFAAVGNHDYYESEVHEKAPPQFNLYLRDQKSSDLGNAVLDLGKVSIIMLNSNFEWLNDDTFNAQWDWFIKQLEANQKINKPVLVSMHHSPFSSSAEWIRPIPTKLREILVPTLEKYSVVKMMISGHLHMYERSQKGRIPYLVAGPSGGIINYITYKNPYQVTIKPFATTFSVFKVSKTQIEVTTFTGLKEMIDHFTVDL